MMDRFRDAATHIQSRSIDQWKQQERPIVGYTCSYVPAEIFHAAGILPIRLRGIETDNMAIGDAYFGPYICTFPKCILQLAGEGRFSFLDGAIITPGCDSMRRLDECWRKAGDDHPGIVPDFFYYFDVPHKTAPHGLNWFEEEIRKLIRAVQDQFGVRITDEKLRQSIAIYNQGRKLLIALQGLRTGQQLKITGADAFAIAVAGTVLPREEFNQELERVIAELEKRPSVNANRKMRLMTVGSISDDIELVQIIEESAAIVVAENLCFGVRQAGDEISTELDPVRSLAKGYLGGSTCPRMYGKYEERLAILVETIKRCDVEGVIMQNIRFCDLHGSENSLFERDLEALGIPCLKIEREYGPLVETGRIRMRVDAFLERVT